MTPHTHPPNSLKYECLTYVLLNPKGHFSILFFCYRENPVKQDIIIFESSCYKRGTLQIKAEIFLTS